jgi:hypothetical protein
MKLLATSSLGAFAAVALMSGVMAETRLTIATVNNGDMIRMQKLTDDFTKNRRGRLGRNRSGAHSLHAKRMCQLLRKRWIRLNHTFVHTRKRAPPIQILKTHTKHSRPRQKRRAMA